LLVECRNKIILKIGVELFKIGILKKLVCSDFINFVLSKKVETAHECD
jgi:hypothetical protein